MVKKVNIRNCYCEIPTKKLWELARLHFIEGVPTGQLMKKIRSQREREYLATIALLDVHDEVLGEIVEFDNPKRLDHFLNCHASTKEDLRKKKRNKKLVKI